MNAINEAAIALRKMINDGQLMVPYVYGTIGINSIDGGFPDVVKAVEFLINYFGAVLPQGHDTIDSESQLVFFGERLCVVKEVSQDGLVLSVRATSITSYTNALSLLTRNECGCIVVTQTKCHDKWWVQLTTTMGLTLRIYWFKNPLVPSSQTTLVASDLDADHPVPKED